MRVLVVSNLYPPHELGGMEIRCKETVDQLIRRGHDCHILTSQYGVEDQAAPEDAVTRTLHLQAKIDYYRPLDFFLRRPGQERANRRALRRALDAFQPDVVFLWGFWNLSTQVAYWAEQWMPGRVAYAIASYWLIEQSAHDAYWERPALRPWANRLMAPARWIALRILQKERKTHPLVLEHVSCVSDYVRSRLSNAGALPHGGRVIHNGIDPTQFLDAARTKGPGGDGMRLVYCGAMLPNKGVHTAVDALGLLRGRGEAADLSLALVGSGHPDYEAQLIERVSELGIDQLVTFHDRVPREEIPAILSRADVFLFTSVWEEPLARSVMEAMAVGLAVIGTPVGGQREMLEGGHNALFFPPGDAQRLAECIAQLRDDRDLRSRLADAGQEMVLEHFTLERMVDEIEAWLEEIAG